MNKKLFILILFLFAAQFAYCQYDHGSYNDDIDDEEKYTIASVGYSLISGGVIAIIGFLIMQIKILNTIGKIILGIGALLGIGTLFIYLLQKIELLLSVAFSLAWKLAIIIGVVIVIGIIIRSIYDWIWGNNK